MVTVLWIGPDKSGQVRTGVKRYNNRQHRTEGDLLLNANTQKKVVGTCHAPGRTRAGRPWCCGRKPQFPASAGNLATVVFSFHAFIFVVVRRLEVDLWVENDGTCWVSGGLLVIPFTDFRDGREPSAQFADIALEKSRLSKRTIGGEGPSSGPSLRSANHKGDHLTRVQDL